GRSMMTHPDRERLLAALPSATAALARRAIADPKERKLWQEAFESVGFPQGDVYPAPDELAGAQHALAELYAYEEAGNLRFALPETAGARRRWLGLEPGGVLEAKAAFTIDGEERVEPLWRALQLSMRRDSRVDAEIVSDAATLL